MGRRKGATDQELRRSAIDVGTGMFLSNLVMYFIILTTAVTLHAHGQTHITTAQQAAEALRPLAGEGAYSLFTLGMIGTGMLGVPVLAGSCAYAIAVAPPLIVVVVMLTSDPKVMGARVSPLLLRVLGWATAVVMTAAAVAMFVTWGA